MIADSVEQQYRRFLLILSGVIFAGTVAELVLVEHSNELLQYLPFLFCGLGILSVLIVSYHPSARAILVHRILMVLIFIGGVFGVCLHFIRNYDFHLEIQPNATTGQALLEALYGSIPLLAPGVIPLAALLAFAAVWRHPVLEIRSDEN